jgi:hypothetical protein
MKCGVPSTYCLQAHRGGRSPAVAPDRGHLGQPSRGLSHQLRREHRAVLLPGEGAEDTTGGQVNEGEPRIWACRSRATAGTPEDPERMIGAALNLDLVRLPLTLRLYQGPEPGSGLC